MPGLAGVTQVVNDFWSTLALAGDEEGGRVYAWGNNACGELGDGTTVSKSTPEYIGLANITQVAAGDGFLGAFSAAVRNDGTLLTWGCNAGLVGSATGPSITTPTAVTALTGVSQVAFGAQLVGLAGGVYSLVIASAPATTVVPRLKGDTLTGVYHALQAAGLVVGTISDVTDYTCNNVGRVSGQDPPAGTAVYYGSAVSITIWVRPPPPHVCP